MFDNLKNLANLPSLMAKAREMQEKMKTMQDELARKQVAADIAQRGESAEDFGDFVEPNDRR